jgi:hypothetical protein
MLAEAALALWTGAGLAWWLVAWHYARKDARAAPPPAPAPPENSATLTIFKPLPPLGPRGLGATAPALASFIAQLGPRDELLLGLHEADRAAAAPFLDEMRALHPAAALGVFYRAAPDDVPNPKIAWQKFLSPHAAGELWLWSDADILAPSGFLRAARAEFTSSGAALLTFPYIVPGPVRGPALLDALFVNVEFHPGVLLLRARGPVDFAFGAAALFRGDDFLRRVDWAQLGGALADDFLLGRMLAPVQIGTSTLATAVEVETWPDALHHYLRWSRTVAWNQPLGSAARILILPLLGWLIALVLHPADPRAWLGLLAWIALDAVFAASLCRLAGCPFRGFNWLVAAAWSPGRVLVWLLCCLPGRVAWRGQTWHGPRSLPT